MRLPFNPQSAIPNPKSKLGRFRNALVTYQERKQPTDCLRRFIDTYALHPYRWPELAKAK